MNSLRTRIARLTAASVLALGLGALASAPALATGTWAGSVPTDSVTLSVDGGASPDGLGKPSGIKSVVTLAAGDDASTDSIGKPSGR